MSKRQILFLALSFILLSFWAKAQNFSAYTDAKDVVEGQAFNLVFEIKNLQNAEMSVPDFAPAKIVNGPFQSTSTRIVNGARSDSKTYTYQLAYSKKGTYTIPRAQLAYKGKTYYTNPIEINVINASKSNAGKGEILYLEKKISDSTIYVGQQFYIDFNVFFQNVDLHGVSIDSDFMVDQFINHFVKTDEQYKTVQKEIEGKLIKTAWINRLSLIPLRSGKYNIPAIDFQADIEMKNGQRRGFFRNRYNRRVLRIDPFEIEVKPLPVGAPESFTGAVGRLSAISTINKEELEVGKEILVRLELIGNGVKDQVNAPKWQQEGFEIFDPKLVSEKLEQQNGEIVFNKVFEYVVIPQEGGLKRLEIPYAYFDTKTASYVEKVSQSTQLNITGTASALSDASQKKLKSTHVDHSGKWYAQLWFWGILVAIAGCLMYYFTSRKPKEKIVTEQSIEEAALLVATRNLAGAKSILDSGNTSKYWETLESSLRIYLEDKIGIGTTSYSLERVEQYWNEQAFPREKLVAYKTMIEKINLARYAGQSIDDMQNIYKDAEQWIVEIEKL